ncbi:MAG: pyridoxamine 5'-phosphate oxidase family protein [Sporichthyaceae bacterium]
MSAGFSADQRALQDRFDTRRLADRIDGILVSDQLSDSDAEFISRLDMFFLATADAQGRPTCSYKGGAPGFVRVLDPHTLAFPSYDGNGMYLSAGNLRANPEVGLLFLDLTAGHRMRVDGTASIDFTDPLLADFPEAQFVVRVRTRAVYPNCPRYLHRYVLEEPSAFVPESGLPTPVPEWKTMAWSADVLPADDPARDPAREVRGR